MGAGMWTLVGVTSWELSSHTTPCVALERMRYKWGGSGNMQTGIPLHPQGVSSSTQPLGLPRNSRPLCGTMLWTSD